MKAKWAASVCAISLVLALGAMGQEDNTSNDPVLKTRPNDSKNTPSSQPAAQQGPMASSVPVSSAPVSIVPPNAIPDGTRFIIKLKDTLDTKKMEDGKHFKAELRED